MVIADKVTDTVQRQLKQLNRAEIAQKRWHRALSSLLIRSLKAVSISNYYGPEHLIVQTKAPRELLPLLDNAGSIFLAIGHQNRLVITHLALTMCCQLMVTLEPTQA